MLLAAPGQCSNSDGRAELDHPICRCQRPSVSILLSQRTRSALYAYRRASARASCRKPTWIALLASSRGCVSGGSVRWNSPNIFASSSHRRTAALAPVNTASRLIVTNLQLPSLFHQGHRRVEGVSLVGLFLQSGHPASGIPGLRRGHLVRHPLDYHQLADSFTSPSATIRSPDSTGPAPSCNSLQLACCRNQPLTKSVLRFRPVGTDFHLSQL